MERAITARGPAHRSTLRIALTPEMADALERRARRNDRLVYLEAGRIIRETLEREGDLRKPGRG